MCYVVFTLRGTVGPEQHIREHAEPLATGSHFCLLVVEHG